MVQDQLRAAHDLIEKGRLAEARQILQTLDDPTARQWLGQLNAVKRSRKQSSLIPLPWLIVIAVVLGVGALIVIVLLTPTLLSRIRNNDAAPTVDAQLVSALTDFCTQAEGTACVTWVQTVLAQYQPAAAACLAPSNARSAWASCLANAGVPPPT